MPIKPFIFGLFLGVTTVVYGQSPLEKPIRSVFHALMLEGGYAHIYDSYLSIVGYSGYNVGLNYERMRIMKYGNYRVTSQQQLGMNYASGLNEARSSNSQMVFLDYSYGLLYGFEPYPGLTIKAGGAAQGTAGVVYNFRNSNNPAAAKGSVDLALSGMAIYKLYLRNYPLTLRYQASIPFAGVFFAPPFGATYYEMFMLGNTSGIVHFGSFHNRFNMQNLFTIDLPVGNVNLRIGYSNTIRTSWVNHNNMHIYTHSLVLGITSDLIRFNWRKPIQTRRPVVSAFY